jgi:UDP-N-acetylmuramoyl-tripeptide--D-alanyl-D-alanine ligase
VATPIGANRAVIDARSAAEATGGRVVRATGGRAACGVTSDSRAVVQGAAFVALKGERYDGHAFVGPAIEAGARLVVVERGRAPADERADAVEVDDTLVAWGALARAHLLAWRRASAAGRVVAITGSAGKTTTKELCAALLRTAGECHATAGNLNNRVGVPAVVFQLEARHRFAVLEVGMNLPGEIAALARIAEPDVAVVMNAGLAHAGGVGGTVQDVAREKGALFEGVRPGGVCVANADDPAVVGQLARSGPGARIVTFGATASAQYRLLERISLGLEGSRLRVTRPGRDPVSTVLPIPGEAAALDFTAALAAAEAATGGTLHASETVLTRALASLGSLAKGDVRRPDRREGADANTDVPLAGRMRVLRARGIVVLDDTYNANPASMRAALATLGECSGRHVAVLGEMKELGREAESAHDSLAAAAAEAGLDLLISCGGLADRIAHGAAALGIDVLFAHGAEDAARLALERVAPGDVVLVKASRSVGAERVVRALVPQGVG